MRFSRSLIAPADRERWLHEEMKGFPKKIAIPIAVIILIGVYLWITDNPSRHARGIVPAPSFEAVSRLLGNPQSKKETDGMTLGYFKPNLGAAGPIQGGI